MPSWVDRPDTNDGPSSLDGVPPGGVPGAFGSWGTAGAGLDQWRPGPIAVGAAAVTVVLLLIAGWILDDRDGQGDVDGSDPTAVATAFVQRYATHDPTACQLATSALRTRLANEGRCAGAIRGASPQVGVISSVTCGQRHTFDAVVSPEGEFGKRFVSLGLERADHAWLVRSVLPIADCRVLTPPACGSGG